MREIKIKVFQYKELTEKAKKKAREWYLKGMDFQFEWDYIKEDAKTAGLKLTAWDYGRYCEGNFIESARECADLILKNHGEKCETYKTAEAFIKERDEIVETAPKDEDGNFEDEFALDKKLDEIESGFLKSILEDYRIMADKQYDYVQSEEAIAEMMEANEYEFDENGKRI